MPSALTYASDYLTVTLMKEWHKLLRNNGTAGRHISIPKGLIEDAGFEEGDEIEGKWNLWQRQGKILVLELRDMLKEP